MARKRRPAPEGSRRRRRRVPVWLKVFWVAVAVVVALALFAVVRKTLRPVRLCYRERAEMRQQEIRLAELKRENLNMREKRRYLQSPAGAETEARKLGYVRPGEVSILMPDEEHEGTKRQGTGDR